MNTMNTIRPYLDKIIYQYKRNPQKLLRLKKSCTHKSLLPTAFQFKALSGKKSCW